MRFATITKKLHLYGMHRSINFFFINKVLSGTRLWAAKRFLLRSLGYEIGEGTKVVGPLFCSANLAIGKNCWIGRELQINGNGWVEIGDNCDIAPQVTFLTGGHAIGDSSRRAGVGERYHIAVRDGCWICANATLLNDIEIGAGAVVAAGAVVTSSVAENRLVGGVPAKEIKPLN